MKIQKQLTITTLLVLLLISFGTIAASHDSDDSEKKGLKKFNKVQKKFDKFEDKFDNFVRKAQKHPEKFDKYFAKLKREFEKYVNSHERISSKIATKFPELTSPVTGFSMASSLPPDEVLPIGGNVILWGPFLVEWISGTYQGITEWSIVLTSNTAGEFIGLVKGVFTGTVDGKSGTLVQHGVFAFADLNVGFVLLGKVIDFGGTGELEGLHGLTGFQEPVPDAGEHITGWNFNF
ncbi:MAG: hypothetical protein ACXAB7_12515 [Candidatus Kariarchaeaceae archaeon]|jgi:hypothetical protein